jgi:hypothetical protein
MLPSNNASGNPDDNFKQALALIAPLQSSPRIPQT